MWLQLAGPLTLELWAFDLDPCFIVDVECGKIDVLVQ